MFNYSTFTERNIGFITETDQETLRKARVFIVGVGGMGGTALACLARAGVGHFVITDIDTFEVSNLNRQVFSRVSAIGKDKAEVARDELLEINPEVKCQIAAQNWSQNLDDLLPQVDVVINGCDDVRATIRLMRKAKEHGKTVIDAYASTLPSVYVVRPQDPRPEVLMNYPSVGREPEALSDEEAKECAARETEFVLIHSSTIRHVVLEKAAEMLTGKRKRISFAPMVWNTGTLIAYEGIKVLLNANNLASCRGYFFNPYTMKIEKPLSVVAAWLKRQLVRYFVKKLRERAV